MNCTNQKQLGNTNIIRAILYYSLNNPIFTKASHLYPPYSALACVID